MPDAISAAQEERRRRWRLVLGGEDADGLSERDLRIDRALSALYDRGDGGTGGGTSRRAGPGASAPRVAPWLCDNRGFCPAPGLQGGPRAAVWRLHLER